VSPTIDLRLPVGPLAPGDARHALDRLTGVVGTGQLDEIRLLVSELVTNSVRHAGMSPEEWIEFRVNTSRDVVRVEVADRGPGFEAGQQVPTMYQDSGWGLYLVEQIADRWGVSNEGGTCVWFEVDL
jgi:anti-sigma regulatory factor (Ser/Thr protein kinase)